MHSRGGRANLLEAGGVIGRKRVKSDQTGDRGEAGTVHGPRISERMSYRLRKVLMPAPGSRRRGTYAIINPATENRRPRGGVLGREGRAPRARRATRSSGPGPRIAGRARVMLQRAAGFVRAEKAGLAICVAETGALSVVARRRSARSGCGCRRTPRCVADEARRAAAMILSGRQGGGVAPASAGAPAAWSPASAVQLPRPTRRQDRPPSPAATRWW